MKPIKLIALFLCCAPCLHGNRICNQSGPRNCTFERQPFANSRFFEPELCGWINDSFSATRGFLELSTGAEQGQLTSELSCSTEGETHCLQFGFKFDVNDTIDLTVSTEPQPQPQPTPEPDASNRTDSPPALWTLSSGSDTWHEARVPISTRGGFRVVFTAKRRLPGTLPNATVYIDNVLYLRSPCEVQPPQAGVRPPTPSTSDAPPTLTSVIGTTATETAAVPAASRGGSATTLVAATTVSAGVFVVAVVGIAVACWVRLKRQRPKHASRPPGEAGGGGGGGAPAAAGAVGSAGEQDTYENCDAEFPRRGDTGASSSEVQRRSQKSEKSPQPPPPSVVYANNDTDYSYATQQSCRDKQEEEVASDAWYELDVCDGSIEESPRLAEEGSVRAKERAAGPGSFAKNPSTRKPSTRELNEAQAEPIYVNFPVSLDTPDSRPGQSGGAKSRADSRGSREKTRVQPAASASASASPPVAEIYEPLQNDLGDCHVYNVTESKRQNRFKALPPPTEDYYYNA